MKKCNKCNVEKEYIEFNIRKASKDGYSYTCKECKSVIDKDYSLKNKGKLSIYIKDYYLKNKEVLLERNKKYYIENIDKIKDNCKDYYLLNKENIIENSSNFYYNNKEHVLDRIKNNYNKDPAFYNLYSKKWRKENPEKVKEYNKLYQENNIEEIKKYRVLYYNRNRNKINEYMRNYNSSRKYIRTWRGLLYRYCRFFSIEKEERTSILLGYTPLMLKQRIECQFKENMSWENYGEWEIDHKKPLSKFGKDSKPSTVNSLSNLQPLWKEENRKKSNNYDINRCF